ncbi:MAG TPA: hypothetical protein VFW04_17355 [Gemmatimonadaceae bacterium]|nr:hypothetical protein [Gemmatimonadaceae bacterium]
MTVLIERNGSQLRRRTRRAEDRLRIGLDLDTRERLLRSNTSASTATSTAGSNNRGENDDYRSAHKIPRACE